jgi:hypothetical protein
VRIPGTVLGEMIGLQSAALVFGVFVSAIPFSFLLWVLYRLPTAIVASHRKWPLILNCLMMTGVAASTALFLQRAAMNPYDIRGLVGQFLIATVVYGFGLVLLLRQFCGVYEDYIITVGMAGLLLWKTSYTNIAKAETRDAGGGEKTIFIETARGGLLKLTLPTTGVDRFYTQVRKKHGSG